MTDWGNNESDRSNFSRLCYRLPIVPIRELPGSVGDIGRVYLCGGCRNRVASGNPTRKRYSLSESFPILYQCVAGERDQGYR